MKAFNLEQAIKILQESFVTGADELVERYRRSEQFFTRNRKISDSQLLLTLLSHPSCASTNALYKVFEDFGIDDVPTKQALSKKREQITEGPFEEVYERLIQAIYSEQNRKNLKTHGGKFVIAHDGSQISLESDKELKEIFGTSGKGDSAVTARASTAFDVLNNYSVDEHLVPFKIGEQSLARNQVLNVAKLLPPEITIHLFDRGYCNTELFRLIDSLGSTFVARVRNKFNLEIDDAPSEAILEIGGILVKVFKFVLNSGEVETLITNDLEMTEMEAFELYSLRWRTEENYKLLKSRLHLENLTGRRVGCIYQDFYITFIQALLVELIAQEVERKSKNKRTNKWIYEPNRSVIVGRLESHLIKILVESDREKQKRRLVQCVKESSRDKIAIRPFREFQRKTPRKKRYSITYKIN